jgi:hypothetical protein
MANTPYKGPIQHLQEYFIKYDHIHTLKLTTQIFLTLINELMMTYLHRNLYTLSEQPHYY